MSTQKYTDITVDIKDGIGTIKVLLPEQQSTACDADMSSQFNRPKALNSFGGNMVADTVAALRELDDHPDTTFTVITGEGRFFCAGADVTSTTLRSRFSSLIYDTDYLIDVSGRKTEFKNDGEKKLYWTAEFAPGTEFIRSMIEHKKVLVLAMNGPGVGAGGSWFQGSSDIFYMAEDAWLQVTFSQLGLIPEAGSAINWANSIGVHRANDWLMFGGKATAKELKDMGLVNKLFPTQGFHDQVHAHLKEMLRERSGKSMMEMKRLQNKPLRDQRILALFDAMQALAERFVDGEPSQRMKAKSDELLGKMHFLISVTIVLRFVLTLVQLRGNQRCSSSISINTASRAHRRRKHPTARIGFLPGNSVPFLCSVPTSSRFHCAHTTRCEICLLYSEPSRSGHLLLPTRTVWSSRYVRHFYQLRLTNACCHGLSPQDRVVLA